MPLAQDILGDEGTEKIDLAKIGNALLTIQMQQAMQPQVKQANPELQRREARREDLYSRLMGPNFDRPAQAAQDKKAKFALGLVGALGNLSYLGGLDMGDAVTGKFKEISSATEAGYKDANRYRDSVDLKLLPTEDRDLARLRKEGHSDTNLLPLLGQVNTMRGIENNEKYQKDLQNYRAQKLKADANKPNKEDEYQKKQNIATANQLYKSITRTVDDPTSRRYLGLLKELSLNIDKAEILLQSAGRKIKGGKVDLRDLKNADTAQLETMFNQMDKQELAEVVSTMMRVLNPKDATDQYKMQEMLPRSANVDVINKLQYFSNKPEAAGAGAFIARIYKTLVAERDRANQNMAKNVASNLAGGIDYFKQYGDPAQKLWVKKTIKDYNIDLDEHFGDDAPAIREWLNMPGGKGGTEVDPIMKDPSEMTPEEKDAAEKALGIK